MRTTILLGIALACSWASAAAAMNAEGNAAPRQLYLPGGYNIGGGVLYPYFASFRQPIVIGVPLQQSVKVGAKSKKKKSPPLPRPRPRNIP